MSGPARHGLVIAGWLFFALGAVGMALPLLPTTIFWILAAWCWIRSSPRLARRVLDHPRVGPTVDAFLARGEMSRRAKLAAVAGIALGLIVWNAAASPGTALRLGVGACLALVTLWLLTRPEPVSPQADGDSETGRARETADDDASAAHGPGEHDTPR